MNSPLSRAPRFTSSSPDGTDAILRFPTARLLAGIRFHLIDEGVAASVDTEAIASWSDPGETSFGSVPMVARPCWEAMNNGARLKWLLDAARADVILGPTGGAVLRRREAEPVFGFLRESVRRLREGRHKD